MPLGMEVGLGPGDCVRWGPSSTSKGGGHSAQIFGPCLLCPNGWMNQNTTRYRGSLSPGDIVSDMDPAPAPLKGHSPRFSADVRCGQTAGWTTMPLGEEVGLGPGDFVFDGDPAPRPIFGACLLWPNGWMDEDAPWYGSRRQATLC